SVSYALTQTCPAPGGGQGRAMPAVTGSMPEGVGRGTVAKYVTVDGCADPLSYAISATVTFGDGHGSTAGLPGGLSLSWDPSVHQLVVRPAASSCKGVY